MAQFQTKVLSESRRVIPLPINPLMISVSIIDNRMRRAEIRARETPSSRAIRLPAMNEAEKKQRSRESNEQRSLGLQRKSDRQREKRTAHESLERPFPDRLQVDAEEVRRLMNLNAEKGNLSSTSDTQFLADWYDRDVHHFKSKIRGPLRAHDCSVCGLMIEGD